MKQRSNEIPGANRRQDQFGREQTEQTERGPTRPSNFPWTWLAVVLPLVLNAEAEWIDKSPHKTAFITVNSVRLHYLDWGGKGETILFLHGLGDTAHIFDDLAPKFPNQFRVLGLTRRGHGQSEKPEAGYDTATLVEDIREFLDALNIKRVILLGHSIAGDELTRFAIVHPDRLIKLVYLDAAHDRAGLPEIHKQLPPELFPSRSDMGSLESFRGWVTRMSFWSEAWEANLREMMVFSPDGKILREAKPGKVSQLLMQGTIESHPDYTKIRSPAISIAVVGFSSKLLDFIKSLPDSRRKKGEDALDKMKQFQQQQMERFRKEIPNGRVVVFTNADHHCFIERENEVVREMRMFLAEAPPSFTFAGFKAGDELLVGDMKLCWCPPGKFMMGSPRNEPERRPGEDQVEVTLTCGFWMGKYEVTQAQWKRVVGDFPGELTAGEGDDFPVYTINFDEAEGFCRKLTKMAHATGELPKQWVFRLPTEAQWEYACRAGTTTATAFGDKLSSKQANFQGKPYNGGEQGPSLKRTAPVGRYPGNAWGLHDMHGNVFEWCRDWYHRKLPGSTDPDLYSAKTSATKSEHGVVSRVRRGGCWADEGWPCRSAFRLRFEPERRHDHIGFRVVAVRL